MIGGLYNKEEYIVNSNELQVGEYLLKEDLDQFAIENHLELIYLEDRIIAPSNSSCYCGNIGGEVFHTFIRITNNIYQYLGTILKDAKVHVIETLPPSLIAYAKNEIKKVTKTNVYIIEFSKRYRPDLTYFYVITAYVKDFEKYGYKFKAKELAVFENLYCNIITRKKNTEKIMYLNSLISKLENKTYGKESNYVNARDNYENEVILLFLKYQRTILNDEQKKYFN